MIVTQHAHIYSFHTSKFNFGEIFFLIFLSIQPLQMEQSAKKMIPMEMTTMMKRCRLLEVGKQGVRLRICVLEVVSQSNQLEMYVQILKILQYMIQYNTWYNNAHNVEYSRNPSTPLGDCHNSFFVFVSDRSRSGRHWIGGERGGKGGAMRACQKWFCATPYFLVITNDQEG